MVRHVFRPLLEVSVSEHERTFSVHAAPEEAYRYLSSVDNLPDFVPYLQSLREEEDGHVFGILNFGDGRQAEASGFFRAYPAEHRLDWESDGTPGYSGWLKIEPESPDRASVRAHISVPGSTARTPDSRLGSENVERAFDAAVRSIQQMIENRMAPTRSAI